MIKNKIISSIIRASPLTAFSLFFQMLRPVVFLNIALPAIGSDSFGIYVTSIAMLTIFFVISDFGLGYRFRARGPKNPKSDETINLHNYQYSTHLLSILLLSISFIIYFFVIQPAFTGLSFAFFLISQFLFYQIHNFYRYTSNFIMMNIIGIAVIIFQTSVVFIGCKYALIDNSSKLIAISSLGQIFPCLILILHKRKSNWFIFQLRKSFIKKELKGAANVKLKQVLDMIPLTADRIIINHLLGPFAVTLFYASMVVSNIISFITKLLGQLTSQHFRISEKKESLEEIRLSLRIMEISITFLIVVFGITIFLFKDIFINLLDFIVGLNNLDLSVLFILLLNAFPMMARGIYNDFCIANEYTRNNRIDSTIYLLFFFGVLGIISFTTDFMIWHVAIAHLISNIFCSIYMRLTIVKKLSYFMKANNIK
jgi:O-antigen/teichoic acid export membrane protein